MLKTIILIVVIAAAVLGGIAIAAYVFHLAPAVAIMDTITSKLGGINIGGLNFTSLAGIASIAGFATTAYKLIQENKAKVAAQADATKQALANQSIGEELTSVTKIKADLETQLSEATQLKEDAFTQLESAKTELSTVKKQLETQISQTESLTKINTNTVKNLWESSGSEWWTDPNTGEKFRLLKLETIQVK